MAAVCAVVCTLCVVCGVVVLWCCGVVVLWCCGVCWSVCSALHLFLCTTLPPPPRYTALGCTVNASAPHVWITCTTVSGVGANHAWVVNVGSQASPPSTDRTSYVCSRSSHTLLPNPVSGRLVANARGVVVLLCCCGLQVRESQHHCFVWARHAAGQDGRWPGGQHRWVRVRVQR